MENKLVVFKGKEIRRTLHKDEWWFSIVNVVLALTDSVNPSGYIKDMRRRDAELAKGWGQIAGGAREKLEKESGAKIVSPENYIDEPEIRKRLKGKK